MMSLFVFVVIISVIKNGDSCGERFISSRNILLDKQVAVRGEFPWIVNVYSRYNTSATCGGVLLSQKFVLLPIKCLPDYYAGNLTVAMGHAALNESEKFKQYSVRTVIAQKTSYDYVEEDGKYDPKNIVLLELESKVKFTKFIQPVCLWNKNADNLNGMNVTVVGWFHGKTQLVKISSKIYDFINCARQVEDFVEAEMMGLQLNIFCVSFKNSRIFEVQKMTGGIFVEVDDRFYLFGMQATMDYNPADRLDLFVDIPKQLNWIYMFVDKLAVKPTTTIASACGRKTYVMRPLMTLASSTHPGDWPWHVALFHKNDKDEDVYQCGGSLITESIVISAAHCFFNVHNEEVANDKIVVQVGKYSLASAENAQQLDVFEIVLHEGFDRMDLKNDIAVVLLAIDAKFTNFVQPVCLWSHDINIKLVGQTGIVVGWGLTENNRVSDDLRMATLPIIDDRTCLGRNLQVFGPQLAGSTKIFCAGHTNGTAVCNGDSGGGLMLEIEGRYFIRGIVSFSSTLNRVKCDPFQYAGFVDVEQHLDWIYSVIKPWECTF